MSDPIAVYLQDKLLFSEVVYLEEHAKQIRQQIGRELLERTRGFTYVNNWEIREVCQLGEDNEKR